MRKAEIKRKTSETEVEVSLNVDGTRKIFIETGVPFFDHMLTLFAFHGGFDLSVSCKGDIAVDDHHSIEDVGIALGQVFLKAVGSREGIARYADVCIPMDESLGRVVVDISNRPLLVYRVDFTRERLGTMDTQNIKSFFQAFSTEAKITLHVEVLYGENDHHKVESLFKATGRVMAAALKITGHEVMSSKGVL